MGLFSNQFANVVEWEEYRDDVIFWKWTNREIKKDSKLIIKPGQDAIFLYNVYLPSLETTLLIHRSYHSFQHSRDLSSDSIQDFAQRFCL